jgi:uncharacterized membrane protein AbrB (regulator of aidB expression)
MPLLYVLAAATACGLLLQALHIPGGLIFGALIGAAGVSLVTGEAIAVPSTARSAAFIVIGATIGVTVTRSTLTTLRPVVLPARVVLVLASLPVVISLLLKPNP